MKIAFLSMYSGLVDRGVETFVHELAQGLSTKHGHEVVVFQGGEARGYEDYKVETINIGPVPGHSNTTAFSFLKLLYLDYWSRKIARFTLKISPKIFKERFDIVVVTNGGWQPVFIRIATLLYRGEMVISGQAGVGASEVVNLWSFPNLFVALSLRAEKWARRINPFIHIEQIPNGVDLQKFKPEGQLLPVGLPRPIILFVGALEAGKRPLRAIEAVANLQSASLIIVGDGPLREEVERIGKQLLPRRFLLMHLPYDQMPKVYRTANVFTIPSRSYYSFEIVLVEAMATNLPVVANDDSVRREIVGDAGILVNPENISEYTLALREALTRSWKDIPQQQARKFSWDKIAERYEVLFKELVK